MLLMVEVLVVLPVCLCVVSTVQMLPVRIVRVLLFPVNSIMLQVLIKEGGGGKV